MLHTFNKHTSYYEALAETFSDETSKNVDPRKRAEWRIQGALHDALMMVLRRTNVMEGQDVRELTEYIFTMSLGELISVAGIKHLGTREADQIKHGIFLALFWQQLAADAKVKPKGLVDTRRDYVEEILWSAWRDTHDMPLVYREWLSGTPIEDLMA